MYFKVMKSSDAQFYFTVNSNNHQVLCTSETYTQKHNALNAINAIKDEASDAPVEDET